jgi:cellulose synthase/poly-beta-1,6-N-acetylglucosamine synthase-like glycosyltransferase
VLLRAKFFPRPFLQGDFTPSVSIVIAARNEAACIRRKLENMLQLDYPVGQFEVLIASDGSTDDTDNIVAGYSNAGVRLLTQPRRGKAQTLNAAVSTARGEVLVFSDANSMFERGALKALVSPLADPDVGGVAGDQRYEPVRPQQYGSLGERRYWDFDRNLKRAESIAGNTISATGAIYAIRKELFQPVPDGVTDDFVTSTRVIAQGKRLMFSDRAVAWEPAATRQQAEFQRKVRIISRGLRGLVCMRCLFNPFRYGFYSLQLLSHKVLRRLMVVPLIVLLLTSLWLSSTGPVYRAAMYGQLAFYLLATVGAFAAICGRQIPKHAAIPAYFCLVNLASLVALIRVLTGRSTIVWEPNRAAGG